MQLEQFSKCPTGIKPLVCFIKRGRGPWNTELEVRRMYGFTHFVATNLLFQKCSIGSLYIYSIHSNFIFKSKILSVIFYHADCFQLLKQWADRPTVTPEKLSLRSCRLGGGRFLMEFEWSPQVCNGILHIYIILYIYLPIFHCTETLKFFTSQCAMCNSWLKIQFYWSLYIL